MIEGCFELKIINTSICENICVTSIAQARSRYKAALPFLSPVPHEEGMSPLPPSNSLPLFRWTILPKPRRIRLLQYLPQYMEGPQPRHVDLSLPYINAILVTQHCQWLINLMRFPDHISQAIHLIIDALRAQKTANNLAHFCTYHALWPSQIIEFQLSETNERICGHGLLPKNARRDMLGNTPEDPSTPSIWTLCLTCSWTLKTYFSARISVHPKQWLLFELSISASIVPHFPAQCSKLQY